VQHYEAALAADPAATSLYYQLGLAYRFVGDTGKARELLAKRGSGKPTVADPILDAIRERATGKQALWMRGFRAFQAGRFAEAAEHYQRMTETDPQEPIAWIELGSALLKMGDIAGALAKYTHALKLAPDNAVAHQNRAICLTQMGRRSEAVRHYRTAIRLDPGLKPSYFHLANELMRLREFEEAAQLYAKAVSFEPGNSFARFMEALALVRLGRHAEARARLEAGLAALPEDLDLTYALARLLASSPQSAVRDGARALQLARKLFRAGTAADIEYAQTLAMALAETGQFDQALKIQQAMIEEARRSARPDVASLLERNYKLYASRQPCRIPWPDDDPVFSPVPGPPTPLTQKY
jgi:tetratricopeptide (TPR) repeat protein